MLSTLESIRDTQKSVPIILAGNKIDLERSRNVSLQGNNFLDYYLKTLFRSKICCFNIRCVSF